MPKLALVYGVRLLPSDELQEVQEGSINLTGDRSLPVTMHVIEGDSADELKGQLFRSFDAFFDFYPEI